VTFGEYATWALRGLCAWLAFSIARRSFMETRTPRRTSLRAAAWVLGIAAFGVLTEGHRTDEDCDSALLDDDCPGYWVSVTPAKRLATGEFWMALVGVPALVGAALGRHRPSVAGAHLGASVDLTWEEVKKKVPGVLLVAVLGVGFIALFLYAVIKLGALGIILFTVGIFVALALAVGVLVLTKRPRKQP